MWYFYIKFSIFNDILEYRKILNKDKKYLDIGVYITEHEKTYWLNFQEYNINLRLLPEDIIFTNLNNLNFSQMGENDPLLYERRVKNIMEWFESESDIIMPPFSNYYYDLNYLNILDYFTIRDIFFFLVI